MLSTWTILLICCIVSLGFATLVTFLDLICWGGISYR